MEIGRLPKFLILCHLLMQYKLINYKIKNDTQSYTENKMAAR